MPVHCVHDVGHPIQCLERCHDCPREEHVALGVVVEAVDAFAITEVLVVIDKVDWRAVVIGCEQVRGFGVRANRDQYARTQLAQRNSGRSLSIAVPGDDDSRVDTERTKRFGKRPTELGQPAHFGKRRRLCRHEQHLQGIGLIHSPPQCRASTPAL